MPDLLVEIGVEELPASFLERALETLEAAAQSLFEQHRLGGTIRTLGTPRRIVLSATGLDAAQADRQETVTGPPWNVAFKDGEPTKAAIGFAKKNGVEVGALEKLVTDKGDYVSAHVHEAGRSASDVLSELLPAACAKIGFPKQMRWGAGDHAFGRPIHWMLALLDDDVVAFDYCDVTSGRETRGHRFLAPETFSVKSASSYAAQLATAHVVVDPADRTQQMRAALDAAAAEVGGVLVVDEFLLAECIHLVEEPFVVPGTFDEAFLELPAEVVISVMRDHQRYFALRDAAGTLLPRYLNVVNTAEDPERIATGNDRVLRARLADAAFFVREDRKQKLEARRPKLDTVVFQRKLGTVGEKVERIASLAAEFAPAFGIDPAVASRAAQLCKCDLESLIVFEFPELQGQMGRYYADLDGEAPEVGCAIEEHYRPAGASDEVAGSKLGALLAVADRVDTLVGCFAIGQAPKGNADPFGLRRAALGILRTALEGPIDVDLDAFVSAAAKALSGQPKAVTLSDDARSALDAFFDTRVRGLLRNEFPQDVIAAAIGAWRESDTASVRDLRARAQALETLRGTDDYAPLAIAFKRAFNIAGASHERGWDESLLEEGTERALATAFTKVRPELDALTAAAATDGAKYADALALVARELKAVIDQYFDDVLVMAEDEAIRKNRLAMLAQIAGCVSRIAHFHVLEGQETEGKSS